MTKQILMEDFEEALGILFLLAGPAIGAVIALAWLGTLILGIVSLLVR